jgi:nitroimidazol reductase NimA-like FMN-containing flavoprotein (pyridoxamine 5'-phosphate oxidase superfamily)
MSRRAQITMDEDEVVRFLDEERVLVCATIGRDGFPHLMPLWYVVRAGELWAWTFAKSQKVKNLERDPRATVQVEAGHEYGELRGVMLKTEVELVRDVEQVTALGLDIARRYTPGFDPDALPDEALEPIRRQAAKRIGMRFVERDRATWDHRKLASGVY